jgi:hypothetical protein
LAGSIRDAVNNFQRATVRMGEVQRKLADLRNTVKERGKAKKKK